MCVFSGVCMFHDSLILTSWYSEHFSLDQNRSKTWQAYRSDCPWSMWFLKWLQSQKDYCLVTFHVTFLPFVSLLASLNLLWLGRLMALRIVFLVLGWIFMTVTFWSDHICPGFYRLSQNNFLVWKINYMVTLDNRKEMLDLVIITNYILIILPKGG